MTDDERTADDERADADESGEHDEHASRTDRASGFRIDDSGETGPEDGVYTAVLDRFEDNLAVFLLEREDAVVDQVTIPRGELSDLVARQNAVCRIHVASGAVVDIDYAPEETRTRAEDSQSRFDRLARRPPEDTEAEDG